MLLGLFTTDTTDTLDRARLAPAAELPPTFGETFHASYAETRAFANSDALWRGRHEAVQKALDAFENATGEALQNPEAAAAGPNRDALERHNQARFDQIALERPDLKLAYPTDEQRQQAAIEVARSARKERDRLDAMPGSFASGAGSIVGDVAGAMTDPLNLLTMALGAGPSAGILRTAAIEAGIGAASQAAIEAGTAGFKKQVDPKTGLPEAIGNIAAAGAGGAVIGGGVKALGELVGKLRGRSVPREVQDAINVTERDQQVRAANPLGETVAGEQAHVAAMQKAAQDMEAGRPVDVSEVRERLRQALGEVDNEATGDPWSPLVSLSTADLQQVIVARGGFKAVNELEVNKSGWGLVKVIWGHGWKSKEPARLQITQDDVLALPEILATKSPIPDERGEDGVFRTWIVEREHPVFGPRRILYGAKLWDGQPGHVLVTLHVVDPNGPKGGLPLSEGAAGGQSASLGEVSRPPSDTSASSSQSGARGQIGAPANGNVRPNGSRVYTSGGRAVDVEYRAVEADTLVTSHGADGTVNPAFPADLQPRDRTRLASQTQIAEMAGQLQPERLGRSTDAATGAPIVGPDMVVESGNGRVAAIRSAYGQGGDAAARYREWVAGQDPAAAGMRNPVLVAVRRTEMDPAGRLAFTREANAATAARLSPTEMAIADARLLDGAALDRLSGGDVTSAGNRPFVRTFLDRLPPSERGSLVDASGALNQEGRKRLEGALLGRAYGDAAIIGRIVEDADSDIRAIGGALLDVAGPWAKMREAVARGDLARGMDVTPDLLAAVRMVAEARASGRAVAELAQQMGLFGDDLSPTARLLLAGLFRDADLSKPAGRARVAEMLSGFLDEASKNTAGPRLFGEPLSADQILRGERMAADIPQPANDRARPAEEVAAAKETDDAIYHDLNRVMAARDPEISIGEAIDPETGRATPVKRTATDLMEEADREIAEVEEMAACVFGMAAE